MENVAGKMAPHHVLKKSQLVVLGMHRSGTSLLTRILHFMGASFDWALAGAA